VLAAGASRYACNDKKLEFVTKIFPLWGTDVFDSGLFKRSLKKHRLQIAHGGRRYFVNEVFSIFMQ